MNAQRVRRRLLGAGALGCAAAVLPRATGAALSQRDTTLPLQAPEPLARLHVDGHGTLLGLSTRGELWRLDTTGWRRVGAPGWTRRQRWPAATTAWWGAAATAGCGYWKAGVWPCSAARRWCHMPTCWCWPLR